MSLLSSTVTLEAVELPDGRFGVQAIGAGGPDNAIGTFDTLAEAEEWIFNQAQRIAALTEEPNILIPGAGQGIR